MFLPPIFYMATLSLLERYYQKHELNALKRVIVRNLPALYEGRYTVKEEVHRNLGEYLKNDLRFRLGLSMNIQIKTVDDRILYPAQTTKAASDDKEFSELPRDSLRYIEVASENYKLLSDGLILSVKAQLRHNSWISNSILILYILIALAVIRISVRRSLKATEAAEAERTRLAEKLEDQLAKAEEKLKAAEEKESAYLARIETLRSDKDGLATDIDALLEEIEKQEAGLSEHTKIREALESQIEGMRADLDRAIEKTKKKRKTVESARKRFAVLYKSLVFTDRAMEGLLDLTDEFQLKAEQVIQKLNDDESAVPVKRKVFGKGGKLNVLEVTFSYSGRIYYQKDSQAKKTIVAVGTKNTQDKDLAYLESLA